MRRDLLSSENGSTDLYMIGRWVVRERKARQWTQAQLGTRAGVDVSVVRHIECGQGSQSALLTAVVGALDGVLRPQACGEIHAPQPVSV